MYPSGSASKNGMRQPQSTTNDDSAPHTLNMNVANSDPTNNPVAVEAGTIEQ